MDIRLVTTSFNDEVHGTFNEKKTGCGINLLKSENVTRYHRGGIMTDLGELTCEKCKTKIAKEMIKSDQKEMKLLLKEEKLRAKKGIVDEGIVPLGNTTAKPTKDQTRKPAPAPKPVQKPEPVAPEQPANLGATIPGTGVAIDNSLAQFAINKPQAEPEPAPAVQDDFLNQFAINKPQQEEEPAPAPAAQDDFLAQFAVPAPAQAEPEPVQEAPAAPPVIDDISAALAAAQNNMPRYEAPVQPEPVQQAAPAPAAPQTDDILSMFSIETPEKPAAQPAGTYDNDSSVIDVAEESLSAVEPAAQAAPAVIDDISAAVEAAQMNVPKYEAPAQPAPVQQAAQPAPAKDSESVSEWDLIANQLFGVDAQPAAAEAPAQEAAPVKEEAAAPAQAAPKTIEPAVYQAAPAAIDDISAAAIEEANKAIEPAVYQASAPVIDDISAAVEAAQSAAPKAAAPVQQAAHAQASAPVIDDISAAVEAAQNATPKAAAPVQQAAPAQASAPIIDDIASAVAAAAQNAPKSVAPAQQAAPAQASAPVIDDIASAVAAAAQNAPKAVAPAPAPVKPAPVKPAPVKHAPAKPAPAPAVQQTAPAGMPAMGQVISVPQITGYDAAKQPIYTYVQMQITGYGENGQPVLSPVPGQEIPEFEMPFNKNTRLQEAIRAAQEVPTSAHEMTPGQRIAAAEAAKGSPISANVSKIATNPHSRATSQAFINAISESKEYANQSLTDTQGLQQRTRVIGSIEDVLSQLGDNSLKQKKAIDAQVQQSIPSFQEYKAPTRTSPMQSAPSRPAPRPMPVDDRPLTKAELKAMKKQEKIDAKFRKEMAKRGGY